MPSGSVPLSRRSSIFLSNYQISTTQLALILLGALAALFLYWPVWRLSLPLEINRNEPWNAWFVDALLKGQPLYPASGELIVNNYPPLSFYLFALLSKITPDVIYAGRLIALLSVGVTGFAVALVVRTFGGSRSIAAFGALWFIAMMARFFTRYVGTYDPNLLALAIMSMAVALFLSRLSERKSVAPAIALMVLAGFVKHNLIAFPLTAMVWLYAIDKRAAFRSAIFGAALALAGLAICVGVFGENFISQMLMPREITVRHMLSLLGKLQWVAPVFIFWGLWAWPNRSEPAVRFSALLLGVSLASALLQAAGAGVSINAFFELIFASAVAIALTFERIASTPVAMRFGAGRIQVIMVLVLALRLFLSEQPEAYLVLVNPSFRAEIAGNARAMDAEIERVRAIPGPVTCNNMTVCYRAGKPFVYDDFWVAQKLATKTISQQELERAKAGICFETIDPGTQRTKRRWFRF